MKKILMFTTALIISATLIGQAPSSFKYQAVLRDARGDIKANTATNIVFTILQGSATGTVVYSETQSVTTDGYGLINLELGNGNATIGTMSAINWNTGIYFVKVTVDGVEMGTNQLLSVPYALFASKAANGFSGNYNDLTNKPVLFDGSFVSLSNKPTTLAGYGITNSFDGTWSSLTGIPAFATVATSGSYTDLSNKPTITNGTVTSVTGTDPISVATGTTTPVISLLQASGTTNGYLSSTDWTTFNNKSSFSGSYLDLTNKPTITTGTVTAVTATAPLSVVTGTTTPVISMLQANGTTSGYLSSIDWLTFNNKSSFDGTWLSLTGRPAFATVATTGSYTDLSNTPITDGSETNITAGTNITVTGTGTTTTPYIVATKAHYIGEHFGGGIVYYVYDGGQHGLIAATSDISAYNGEGYDTYFPWFEFYYIEGPYYVSTNTTGDGLGAGAMNTSIIIGAQDGYSYSYWGYVWGNFAAKVCADYSVTGEDGINYGDWYLPSLYELNLLYQQKDIVGGFNDDFYWSSTEYDYVYTWYQDFTLEGDGSKSYDYKDYYYHVRAIRAF